MQAGQTYYFELRAWEADPAVEFVLMTRDDFLAMKRVPILLNGTLEAAGRIQNHRCPSQKPDAETGQESSEKDGSGIVTPFTGFEVMAKTPIYIVAYALLALSLICFILVFVFSKKEGKEKLARYFSIGGMSLAGISAVLMIFGQNTIEANGQYVNLSYGFFLMIAFAILGAALSLMPIFAEKHFDKIKKEEALETQSE